MYIYICICTPQKRKKKHGKKNTPHFFFATVPWTRRAAPVFSAPERSVQVVEMRSAMEKIWEKYGLIVAKDLKIYLVKMC